jgi:hypothetical protein
VRFEILDLFDFVRMMFQTRAAGPVPATDPIPFFVTTSSPGLTILK